MYAFYLDVPQKYYVARAQRKDEATNIVDRLIASHIPIYCIFNHASTKLIQKLTNSPLQLTATGRLS